MVDSSIDKHLTSWVVLLLILSVSFSASGESLVVSKQGGGFHSIQKAINKASAGDVVYVEEGTYRENLNLNKKITIKGPGPKTVNIVSKEKGEPVISAGPSNSKIKLAGVAIKGATGSKCPDLDKGICPVGLSATGEVSISVIDAQINGNARDGLLLQDSSRLSLVNSLVAKNGENLKGDSNIFYAGIELRNSSQANLKDVELIENRIGLLLSHSATVEIKKCRVSGSSEVGVWVANQAKILIESSEILNSEVGVRGFGGKVKLANSKISENKLGLNFLVTSASLENVSIKGNEVGGDLREGSKVRLKYSTIRANGRTGLKVFNSKVNLYNTEFVKNGSYGLHLFEGSASTVKDSSFENHESAGILLQKTSKARVVSSSFKENGKAVQMAESSRLELNRAKITNNDTGIEISIPEDFTGKLSGFSNMISDNATNFSGVSENTQKKLVAEKE
ncbi:right-handed parallel beta-helix repeat-containing protein [Candidatus Bipolaricaulota bacterium]|nr:right-handed parallel beta-helix repeat-containing protein [Candidatus Bipolaricaulota bacterium]